MWLVSKRGAISNWSGATSLWRVLTGTPRRQSSFSTSAMTPAPGAGSSRSSDPRAAAPWAGRAPKRVRSQVIRSGRGEEELPVDQEVLLLRAHRGEYPGRVGSAPKSLRMRQGLPRERLHGAEERDLGVERLAGPGDEGGGDDQGDVPLDPHQEGGAGRVPRGVAAGLERRAQAAGREARGVGLALHQVAAREVVDHAALAVRRHQRVMLLGGETR